MRPVRQAEPDLREWFLTRRLTYGWSLRLEFAHEGNEAAAG
jgi:hypothetical protein